MTSFSLCLFNKWAVCFALNCTLQSLTVCSLSTFIGPITVFQYKVYPQRWWILLIVLLLNIANSTHLMAFPSVSHLAANYYNQTSEKMELIPKVSFALGIPSYLLAIFVVERFGLRIGLHVGGYLTAIG